jgi:hypothetical protein
LLISTHEEQVDFSERSLISQASTACLGVLECFFLRSSSWRGEQLQAAGHISRRRSWRLCF